MFFVVDKRNLSIFFKINVHVNILELSEKFSLQQSLAWSRLKNFSKPFQAFNTLQTIVAGSDKKH